MHEADRPFGLYHSLFVLAPLIPRRFMHMLMTSIPSPPPGPASGSVSNHPVETDPDSYEGIDLREIFARLCRGLAPTLGFAVLGFALAGVVYLAASPFASVSTSMRVTFAFNGYGIGEYPDHSKFQPDDLRAPDIIGETLKRQMLDVTEDFQSKIRAAITVEGLIPPNVIKERDRLRAGGQTPAPYIPDEYLVTLTLPRDFPLGSRQREVLLNGIVSSYQEKFQRTYAELPTAFGNAFESLHKADYFEYELILNEEIQDIASFLSQQLDQAKTFRSPTTNYSFGDLIRQTDLFSQIQLSETLGIIRQNGLSANRAMAMVKMDYYLRALEDREQKAIEEEKVVDELLNKTLERSQNYVLGIKSDATQQRPGGPILDQGLIDSLLANDASNFLVRRALEAGLNVKRVQAEKAQLLERRKSMETFLNDKGEDQSALIAQVKDSLASLETAYKELISNIRKTHADFARQRYADSVRVSMQPATGHIYRPMASAVGVGAFLGLALGIGLSLIGIYVGPKRG